MASTQFASSTSADVFGFGRCLEIAGNRLYVVFYDGTSLCFRYSDDSGANWSGSTTIKTGANYKASLFFDAANGRMNFVYSLGNATNGALYFRAITSNVATGTPGSMTTEVTIDAGGTNVGVSWPTAIYVASATNPRYWIGAQKMIDATHWKTVLWYANAGSSGDTAGNWTVCAGTFNTSTANDRKHPSIQWWSLAGADKLTAIYADENAQAFEAVTFDPTATTPTCGTITTGIAAYTAPSADFGVEGPQHWIHGKDGGLVFGRQDYSRVSPAKLWGYFYSLNGVSWSSLIDPSLQTQARQTITRVGEDFYIIRAENWNDLTSGIGPIYQTKINWVAKTISAISPRISDAQGNPLGVLRETAYPTIQFVYRADVGSPFACRFEPYTIPQFPKTGLLDDFSGTLGNWTNPAYGNSVVTITSGQLKGTNASNQNAAQWKLQTYGPACEVWATVVTIGLANEGIRLRLRESDASASPNAYVLVWNTFGGAWELDRVDAGAVGAVLASGSIPLANGDAIGLQAIGNILTVWRRPAGYFDFALVATATDNTYTAAGYIGVRIQNTTMAVDNVGGGTIPASVTIPPNTPPLDTFDGTLSGWGVNMEYNYATMSILSSQLKPTADFQSNMWLGLQNQDHEAWATIGALPGSGAGKMILGVRSIWAPNTFGSFYNTLYTLTIYPSGAAYLERILLGSAKTIGDYGVAGTFAAGDKVCLRVKGSTLSVWRNRSGVWTLLGVEITNTEITSPGRIGLLTSNDATFAARFNDFGGGLVPDLSYEAVVRSYMPVRYYPLADSSLAVSVVEDNSIGGTSTVVAPVVLGTPGIVPGSIGTCGDFIGGSGCITQDATRRVDLTTLAAWTMEAWIQPDVIPSGGVNAGIIGSSQDNGWAMHLTGNQLSASQTDLRAPSSLSVDRISAGVVYMVSVTYDKPTRTANWYINGVPSGSGTYSGDPANGLGSGSIGTRTQGSESDWFNGRIQHAAIYNVKSSPVDIMTRYLAGVGIPTPLTIQSRREHFGPF